ncbi:hypothetical protein FIV07_22490 [Mycobacterium sp. THAF192]|nr:hypothetical protein FIV07_22490 [Mycobacterium sp. THAF192]
MPDVPALLNPFSVPCRYCGAVAGEQCRNDITGRPLRKAVAHPVRIHDADLGREDER